LKGLFAVGFSEDVRSAFRRGETEAVVRMSEAEIARARAAGDPAYLIGVTDAAFAALGQLPDPDDAVDLDRARAAVIGALGSPAYTEEHARGLASGSS
jgi:hypothetical protein